MKDTEKDMILEQIKGMKVKKRSTTQPLLARRSFFEMYSKPLLAIFIINSIALICSIYYLVML